MHVDSLFTLEPNAKMGYRIDVQITSECEVLVYISDYKQNISFFT